VEILAVDGEETEVEMEVEEEDGEETEEEMEVAEEVGEETTEATGIAVRNITTITIIIIVARSLEEEDPEDREDTKESNCLNGPELSVVFLDDVFLISLSLHYSPSFDLIQMRRVSSPNENEPFTFFSRYKQSGELLEKGERVIDQRNS
ncbi:hypothetical protein PENTCL1PPCAC_15508, partial [Pristionchus entomophagus]